MSRGGKINRAVEKMKAVCAKMPVVWDGRKSILEMKNAGFAHWKQMEWAGFYFQFLCENRFADIVEIPGKKYGNVEFDAFNAISWDFKAHAANTTSHRVITNDTEAILNTIDDYGCYGLVLAIGQVKYNDEQRTFKKWHDELKGGKSDYEKKRIERGAMSRRRKTEFVLSEIHFVRLDKEGLNQCSGSFQKGFRNADGSPRRSKVLVDIREIPDNSIVASCEFQCP